MNVAVFVFGFAAWLALTFPVPAHAYEWDIGAQSRQRQEALVTGRVVEGIVLQTRAVRVEPTGSANVVSTGVGGLLGAAIGSQVGKGKGRMLAGTLGAILGGAAGNALGDEVSSANAQELIVKKSDGEIIAITQAESSLQPGQPVYLVDSYGKVRVIPKHTGFTAGM